MLNSSEYFTLGTLFNDSIVSKRMVFYLLQYMKGIFNSGSPFLYFQESFGKMIFVGQCFQGSPPLYGPSALHQENSFIDSSMIQNMIPILPFHWIFHGLLKGMTIIAVNTLTLSYYTCMSHSHFSMCETRLSFVFANHHFIPRFISSPFETQSLACCSVYSWV